MSLAMIGRDISKLDIAFIDEGFDTRFGRINIALEDAALPFARHVILLSL